MKHLKKKKVWVLKTLPPPFQKQTKGWKNIQNPTLWGLNYLIVSLCHGESIHNSALGRQNSRHLQAR